MQKRTEKTRCQIQMHSSRYIDEIRIRASTSQAFNMQATLQVGGIGWRVIDGVGQSGAIKDMADGFDDPEAINDNYNHFILAA